MPDIRRKKSMNEPAKRHFDYTIINEKLIADMFLYTMRVT